MKGSCGTSSGAVDVEPCLTFFLGGMMFGACNGTTYQRLIKNSVMQGRDEKYRIIASNPTKNSLKRNSCNSQKSGQNIQDKICVEWE